MKQLFLFVAFYTVVLFGATPPGGLAFKEDKKDHENRFSLRRRCVRVAKVGVHGATILIAHGLMGYVTIKYLQSETFQQMYACESPERRLEAPLRICGITQGCCMGLVTIPLCEKIEMHCKAACRSKKQSVKKKNNGPAMVRD